MNFTWNHSSDSWRIEQTWTMEKDTPLTSSEQSELDVYMQSRITHSDDVYQYNRSSIEPSAQLRERLKIPLHKKVAILFTNVLWDAASSDRDILFSSPIDWVTKTIELAQNYSSDLHLVIRIHPAELVIGTQQRFQDVLSKLVPMIPSNVTVLTPDVDINSWTLYDLGDVGLVHTTTAGLEMVMKGKPVIVVSETHYRDKGFTIDPSNIQEYRAIFENLDSLNLSSQSQALALKYAYLVLLKYQYQFPFIDMDKNKQITLNHKSIHEVLQHSQFKHLIDCIGNQTPIMNP